MSLDAIYASHPVSERNILARLRRQNIPLTGLDEWTLAIDPDTDISDQNHSGGVQSVLALAIAARISASSTVVDIGAGIGGSARVLAQAFGCSVVAVERDSERCQQALRLTALVGLSDRVRFLEHDALVNTPDIENADALWGQSAWAHFPGPDRFLDLWLPLLRRGGRVAMSDAFLLREPAGPEDQLIRELEQLSAAHFLSVDSWRRALETRGCEIAHVRDRTEEAKAHYTDMLAAALMWPPGTVTSDEKRGWTLAGEALQRGLLRMCQLVAVKL
jgi:predicted O-methyltransferase YrrM